MLNATQTAKPRPQWKRVLKAQDARLRQKEEEEGITAGAAVFSGCQPEFGEDSAGAEYNGSIGKRAGAGAVEDDWNGALLPNGPLQLTEGVRWPPFRHHSTTIFPLPSSPYVTLPFPSLRWPSLSLSSMAFRSRPPPFCSRPNFVSVIRTLREREENVCSVSAPAVAVAATVDRVADSCRRCKRGYPPSHAPRIHSYRVGIRRGKRRGRGRQTNGRTGRLNGLHQNHQQELPLPETGQMKLVSKTVVLLLCTPYLLGQYFSFSGFQHFHFFFTRNSPPTKVLWSLNHHHPQPRRPPPLLLILFSLFFFFHGCSIT